MELPLYKLDAFTDRVFAGNPAAVCPLEAWLPEAVMQAIAAENNLSETAFLVPNGKGYAIRWFTPVCEADLCGHATLASAHVICTRLRPELDEIAFESASGPLRVMRQGEAYTLDFPAQPGRRLGDRDALTAVAAALGREPSEVWRASKSMAVLASEAAVAAVAPDMAKVAVLPSDGLIVTAPGSAVDFVSRYFAPAAGIPEDPVTGSAHCTLTPYWAARLGKPRLSARQISARGGALTVELKGERVLITGRVTPYLEGRIHVPG